MIAFGALACAMALANPLEVVGPPKPGIVFVIGGIGGCDPLQFWARVTLKRQNLPHELRPFEWTHGKGRMLRDLQDQTHLQTKAQELADSIAKIMREESPGPIYLMGHSAGACIALETAKRLPPGSLERIILLAPAVSPTYDLRPPLRATRHEIVSFNSTADRFFLDWGTNTFGTADRVYGPAAGLDGFEIPSDLSAADRELYGRFVQFQWRFDDLWELRGGLHHSCCMPIFLAHSVLPWLQPECGK